jgi:hypothetical protein
MAHPLPCAPRWSTLAGLGAVVLGVHLWLLTGDGSDNVPSAPPPTAAPASATTPQQSDTGSTSVNPATPRPVTVSQVRWVSPPPPPVARPTAVARAAPGPTPSAPTTIPATPSVETSAPVDAADSSIAAGPPNTAPETDLPSQTHTPAPTVAQAPGETVPIDAGAGQPLPPARVPGSAQLTYQVNGTIRGVGYSAQATLAWTVDGGRYDAAMSVRLPLIGSRAQTSSGRLNATGLLPERFADKARSERAAHFEHEQQRIRFSSNAPDAALLPGAQDRLSVFLQLAARLSATPVTAGQVIELQVAGTGGADLWRFQVGEEDTLSLPVGELRARRLLREAPGPNDSQVELWLAPSMDHLPVRIRIAQSNGDQIDQQLSRRP